MTRIMARRMKAAADRAWRSKSRASRRFRLIQARVRSTNACTMLPGSIHFDRCSAASWTIRWGNPEDDLDASVVDLDPANDRTDDLPHADRVEAVEPGRYLGGEVFQAANHEGEVALVLGHFDGRPVPLLELGEALFQAGDARLELRLVDDGIGIAVDQPADPRRKVVICCSRRMISSGSVALLPA